MIGVPTNRSAAEIPVTADEIAEMKTALQEFVDRGQRGELGEIQVPMNIVARAQQKLERAETSISLDIEEGSALALALECKFALLTEPLSRNKIRPIITKLSESVIAQINRSGW